MKAHYEVILTAKEGAMKLRLLFVAVCLWCTQAAFAAQFGDWVVESNNGTVVALVLNQSGSSLSMVCRAESCALFLVTSVTCQVGNIYAYMVNTNSGVTFTRAECEYVPNVGLAYKLEDWQQLVPSLLHDVKIGFACALKDGNFSVSHFSLLGSSEALHALMSQLQPTNPGRSQLRDSIM